MKNTKNFLLQKFFKILPDAQSLNPVEFSSTKPIIRYMDYNVSQCKILPN